MSFYAYASSRSIKDRMGKARTILNEDDLTLKERHSFDDLVSVLYPKTDIITDRIRNHFMMEVFFE